MRALYYDAFDGPVSVRDLPDPQPGPGEVVVRVVASGICRSDWHGWRGHDPDIVLPHVPGHEFAGVVEGVGAGVERWRGGERVTVPFVAGCGRCPPCASGNPQVCDHQSQPGFTHWGSFAELVVVRYADGNLVELPNDVDFVTAAGLGCRFITAYRAVVVRGRAAIGEWVVVHGCGGVGLSAIMIAHAVGARVIGVDISNETLELARSLGADVVIDARETLDVVAEVQERTNGGAHLSLDTLGSRTTCLNSIACLRKLGRHVQVGLLLQGDSAPPVPLDAVIAKELEILGSHGMQADRYSEVFALMKAGRLDPARLVGSTVNLEQGADVLRSMGDSAPTGMAVIDTF